MEGGVRVRDREAYLRCIYMYILKYYECRDFRFYRGGVKSQRIKERPKEKEGRRTEEQRTEGEIKDQNYIFNLFKNIKYMSEKMFLVRRT